MEEWITNATDLELGDKSNNWLIEREQVLPKDGKFSLKFYIENWNDAGKIWI